jgi:hypothetical protein
MGEGRYITILLLVLLISGDLLRAQESKLNEQILLHGLVMDASTQRPLSNVHYIINNDFGGATTDQGKFSMYIYRSDTVVFSYMGYSDFQLNLSDTLVGNSFVAGVFMETDTLAIGEVIVLPRMGDLRSEFRNTNVEVSRELVNARNNLEVATYQGLNSESSLGEPGSNYELLRRKQIITANEMGGIPSDQMIGLSIFSTIPAAIYLLKNGLPQKPAPPEPHVSNREINRMIELYRKSLLDKREKNRMP